MADSFYPEMPSGLQPSRFEVLLIPLGRCTALLVGVAVEEEAIDRVNGRAHLTAPGLDRRHTATVARRRCPAGVCLSAPLARPVNRALVAGACLDQAQAMAAFLDKGQRCFGRVLVLGEVPGMQGAEIVGGQVGVLLPLDRLQVEAVDVGDGRTLGTLLDFPPALVLPV